MYETYEIFATANISKNDQEEEKKKQKEDAQSVSWGEGSYSRFCNFVITCERIRTQCKFDLLDIPTIMFVDLDDSEFDYGVTDEDPIDRDHDADVERYMFCCV